MAEYEFHEIANIFPLMMGADRTELLDDIKRNGLVHPIEVYQGKILDGRNRHVLCKEAGVEPRYIEINPANPVDYVVSVNIRRRHLTPSQLALVAARVRAFYDDEARKRQIENLRRGSETPFPAKSPVAVTLPERDRTDARDEAGKAVGVCGKYVDYGSKVLRDASPDLVRAVEEGRIGIKSAAIATTENAEEQARIVATKKRVYAKDEKARPRRRAPKGVMSANPLLALRQCVEELWRLTNRSPVMVSILDVQVKVKELRELAARLKSE